MLFTHLKLIRAIFILFLLILPYGAHAQWDVTEPPEGDGMSKFKDNSSFDLKQGAGQSVEMQADQVEYSGGNNMAKASGNVVVSSGKTIFYADQMELNRSIQQAIAHGHVYLDAPMIQLDADSGTYNFNDGTGAFQNARVFNEPFQIKGRELTKVSDTHMEMKDGFMTTCDHDKPHFRMQAKKMDIYQGDKAVARGIKIYIGNVPIMYLPRYTQDLKNKPWFTFVPGYSKDLGYYLLTRSRIKINEYLTTTLRVDLYERQGIAWGSENKYKTPTMGSGLVRHYFINERSIGAKHPWQEKTIPTVQNERYQLEWRHKWEIDETTNAIWQYYRLSDNVILKKYFKREYRRDPSADTYFLLTKVLPHGTLSFRVDHRVNRFVEAVDRTPEIKYEVSGLALGESGFYLKSNNSFVDLVKRAASPTEDRKKTIRLDSDNEISYPTHISFVQFTPFVGGDTTYYTRTIEDRYSNIIRGTFKTGADLTTRFMKVFNLNTGGRLTPKATPFRHIISPTVSYRYQHEPSFQPVKLNQFDSIDALDKAHSIGYSLENKLQTKRNNKAVDLVRNLTSMEYTLRQKGIKGQLGDIKNLLELTPSDWQKTILELSYDHKKNRLSQGNLDFYFTKDKKFGVNIGDRYVRGGEHQMVTQLAYVVNPKWRFKTYSRFEINKGILKEEGYAITRDLHEWEVDVRYNQTRGVGTEIMLVFRLKAFPDQPLDLFGTTFHERKAGSQSSIGD